MAVDVGPQRYYHGTRTERAPGDRIAPNSGFEAPDGPVVALTTELDAAIWAAELAPGDGPARVYVVTPTGAVEAPTSDAPRAPGPPAMTLRSRAPLVVDHEVTEWTYYHGTRAALEPGDLIEPGRTPNFGDRARATKYVYFARTLDAATWGAELADGEGPGRIYLVEPTGPFEDDPNLTNQKFRGNPTKSFRSQAPLRVTGELCNWQGHAPELIRAMKEGLARLAQMGVEPMDD